MDKESELLAFRLYLTDTLFYQAQEQRLTVRYADMLFGINDKKEMSAEEIMNDIVERAELEVV